MKKNNNAEPQNDEATWFNNADSHKEDTGNNYHRKWHNLHAEPHKGETGWFRNTVSKLNYKEDDGNNTPFYKTAYFLIPIIALLDTIIIELLNHKVFQDGLGPFTSFIGNYYLAFIVNFFLILVTLSPAFFFKRRIPWCLLLSYIWLGCGIGNGFIRLHRLTPFTTADLTVLNTGLETLPNYLSTGYIVLIVVGILILLALFVWLLFLGPKNKESLKKRLISGLLAVIVSVSGAYGIGTLAYSMGHLSNVFPNLAIAFDNYGFGFCFLETWLQKGITEPRNYSEEKVDEILSEIEKKPASSLKARTDVNVIFVQLESFCDPSEINGLELSENAAPNWTKLKKSYSHGYLTVPVVGAGTANTEYEVLTGMSTRYFGPGEYPYKTCLMESTVESTAYNLKENGYATHAIHNHRAAFYGRNTVYSNLGFDDFTGLEYMPQIMKTENNWCKDYVLTSQIRQALDSTPDQSDFIFTVTVQCHGSYPSEPVLESPRITVNACADEDKKYCYEYYFNQVYETDQFIGTLTETLKNRDEKTMVVFYSDHLPSLDLTELDMKSGSTYNTEYVIWTNYRTGKVEKDLYSYQLSAQALKSLRISTGILNKFQQYCIKNKSYHADLKMLQYDILYGNSYTYKDKTYEQTDMKMGISDIVVQDVVETDDYYIVRGINFTPYCKITVGDDILRTEFVSSTTLRTKSDLETTDPNDITISVVDKNKEVLSTVNDTSFESLIDDNE